MDVVVQVHSSILHKGQHVSARWNEGGRGPLDNG